MLSKKNSLIVAALVTVSSFLTAAYVSCTKPLQSVKYSCNGVVCSNGGYCDSARCICPVGYEGMHCETGTVDKFIGRFGLTSTVIGSDSLALVNSDTTYDVLFRRTATPTTFFIDNFAADPLYSSIVCLLDSNNLNHFFIDTTSRLNMAYDHYRIVTGQGTLTGDSVLAFVVTRHLTSTVNWQNDTMRLKMYRK